MLDISVTINGKGIEHVSISNTGERLHGQTVYKVFSFKRGLFTVMHSPEAGLNALLTHVFGHLQLKDQQEKLDTPTTEEEINC